MSPVSLIALTAFASACGGVFFAGLMLIAALRLLLGSIARDKLREGEACPVCKQRKMPVEADVVDFFGTLEPEQVHLFVDRLTDRQRKLFATLVSRIDGDLDRTRAERKGCH